MASDFKLFKKKDDKKNNGQNFSLSDKSKFAIVESYKAARTNIMFSLSAKEKKCFAVTSYSKGEGKSTVITNFIAPQYDNAGPLMVFGDSSGDWNMMTDWMESGDTELGVIFNRYRKPGSDPIWQGSNEAAQSIGDPDARFVLQGRDENTGELRPSEKSILLGETDEVLVRPAE